jgi:hypothetical protein
MMQFSEQASWAKKTSPGGKLKALICHSTKKVNIAEELTYLSTNSRGTTSLSITTLIRMVLNIECCYAECQIL